MEWIKMIHLVIGALLIAVHGSDAINDIKDKEWGYFFLSLGKIASVIILLYFLV